MIIKRDEAFKTVCEFRTIDSIGRISVGTGVFVFAPAGENKFCGWIVTASHVAKTTDEKTNIVVATKDGRSQTIPLKKLGDIRNWRHHSVADISAFMIQITDDNCHWLQGRFLPLDHINTEKKVVSRDYELTAIGFPHGLGTEGSFSPFTFRSYASSGFVTLQRADTHTLSEFFCLENPSVGGYSGCPVFDLGYSTNGVMTITKEKTICHGIMHGTMSDNTGGKIAMVTPTFYLLDIIDKI